MVLCLIFAQIGYGVCLISFRPIDGKENGQTKTPGKYLHVSLSDFLNRKLQKGSILPKSVQVPCHGPIKEKIDLILL